MSVVIGDLHSKLINLQLSDLYINERHDMQRTAELVILLSEGETVTEVVKWSVKYWVSFLVFGFLMGRNKKGMDQVFELQVGNVICAFMFSFFLI